MDYKATMFEIINFLDNNKTSMHNNPLTNKNANT